MTTSGGDGTTNRGHVVPRHVWVAPAGRWQDRCVGILLDQRRGADGWEVLVTWATGGGNVTVTGHTSWLPASLVRKLDEMK
jgi:hypothetical protein